MAETVVRAGFRDIIRDTGFGIEQKRNAANGTAGAGLSADSGTSEAGGGSTQPVAGGQENDTADRVINTTSDDADGNSNTFWIISAIAALIAIAATVT